MNLKLVIDENLDSNDIVIKVKEINDEINTIIQKLSISPKKLLVGIQQDQAKVLNVKDIIRFYTVDKKVFAETADNQYEVKPRIYELSERFEQSNFLRISNSEIINLEHIQSLDISFSSTICIKMDNSVLCYASRRYVKKIKEYLGIWGGLWKKQY